MAGFYKEFMAALHAGLEEEMAKNAAVLAFSYIGRCALSVLFLTLFSEPVLWSIFPRYYGNHYQCRGSVSYCWIRSQIRI